MKINSYAKISSLLVTPALITLLVGCGNIDKKTLSDIGLVDKKLASLSPEESEFNSTIKENIQNVQYDSIRIEPMYIDNYQIKNATTQTVVFDSEDETTDNWIIFDTDPVSRVANVDIDGNHVILLDGDGMKTVAEKMIDMMGTTQSNLLKAQENFNALLLGLAGHSVDK